MFTTNYLKKVIVTVIFVTLSAACFALPQNGYIIKGSTESKDGTKVLFYNHLENKLIDSAVVANGSFVFKGTVEEPFVGYIREPVFSAKVIVEPGEIILSLSETNVVSGTPFNIKMQKYNTYIDSLCKPLNQRIMAIVKDIMDSIPSEKRQKEIEKISAQRNKVMEDFYFSAIKDNNNILGILFCESFLGESSYEDYFNQISVLAGDKVKTSDTYLKIAKRFEAIKKRAVGRMFSDFTIPNGNINGSSASLSDYVGKGKYILVDFWASWCGPCRFEIPYIKENYTKYAAKGFDVLSVAVWDKREATLKAIEEEQLPWNQIIDAKSIPSEVYGFNGIPCIILFAPDGTVYANDIRGEEIGITLKNIFNK